MIRLRLAAAFFLALISAAKADTIASADRTMTQLLSSPALEEVREIYVRVPIGYDPKKKYPVVYVLDGEWNFELVAAHLDYMTDNGVMAPMIVTGVRNVNRNRDYLPVPDTDYVDSGGAEAFLNFVESDWIPNTERLYAAGDERILIGHSFGGVFTLHAFFERPRLFDAYIAISASAWIGDRALFDAAQKRFAKGVPKNRFVYMAPGEFDGGPTRPSGESLAELFATSAPEDLDWTLSIIPGAEHFRAFTGGVNEAFNLLFPSATSSGTFAENARRAGEAGGAGAVKDWFAEKERALGYRFFPAWFDFGVAAIRLSRTETPEAGLEMIEQTLPYHRNDANFAAFSAQVHENNGLLTEAAEEYTRAISLANEYGLHPNVIHLDRLQAGLDRVQAKITTAAATP